MPRRENPVDLTDPQLAEFAVELRELRDRAGYTYRQLAKVAACSSSQLSAAASGKSLPTWEVTRAYVRGCDPEADLARWERRWKKLSRTAKATARTAPQPQVRPPSTLDSSDAFLRDLRAVFHDAELSLREIARRSGYAASTVSTTLRAATLPSWERTADLLTAAGIAGPALRPWQERWHRIKNADPPAPPVEEPPAAPRDEAMDGPEIRWLATQVVRRYREQVRSQAIDQPAPLPVRWHVAAPHLSDHWAAIRRASLDAELGPLDLSGTFQQIRDVYRRVPSGRLVVLGGPGAGKSTLALQLAVDLLATAPDRGPVPVIFEVRGWNPLATPLQRWLGEQLLREFPNLADADRQPVADLLASGAILPLLDGLDEIPAPVRRSAAAAINAYNLPLVLTCRTAEYVDLVDQGTITAAAAVIVIDPLSADDVANYLRRTVPVQRDGSTKWDPVLAELHAQPEGSLAIALTTPLMVTLARLVYAGFARQPTDLLGLRTRAEVEDRLLDGFIPAMYHADAAADRRRWLAFLANHLRQLGARDIELWRLGDAVPRPTRITLTAFAVATAVAAVGGAGIWAVPHAIAGLTALACMVLFFAVAGGLASAAAPVAGRHSRAAQIGCGALLLAGATWCGAVYEWRAAFVAIVAAAVILVPVRLPIRSAEPPASPALALGRLRLDAFVFMVTTAAPLVGLWYVTGHAGPRPEAHPVLLKGICAGCLMVGLAVRDWGRWMLLVRLWLPVRGLLPWRLGRFAEDARQRGIFRRVGAVYQFREIRLQHRLAADQPPSAPWHRLRSTRRAAGLTLAWGGGTVLLMVGVGAAISALARVARSLEVSDLNTTIRTVINFFSLFTGIVAIIMIIVGGFKYVTSGGDAGNITSAKNTVIYAVAGLLIVAMAQLIVQFVVNAAIK
jgi:transcriptional regulator with XRE-family HTH domain